MISNFDFNSEIAKDNSFVSKIFDYQKEQLIVQNFSSKWMIFENCTFMCDSLTFQNLKDDYILELRNCTFHCDVFIINVDVKRISFTNTVAINLLRINLTTVNIFEFSNNSKDEALELSSNFEFTSCTFTDIFQIINLKHIDGRFRIASNKFIQNDMMNSYVSFVGSSLNNFYAVNNDFAVDAYFFSVTFSIDIQHLTINQGAKQHSVFKNNTFSNVDFSYLNIINKLEFLNCNFKESVYFNNCKELKRSNLRLTGCEFKSLCLLNNAKINLLEIERCTFDKSVSFADTEFNTLRLVEVKFASGAYFDEMKIHDILNKVFLKKGQNVVQWKRTLRAIKQEFQKNENKIEYNRFRAYELATHYEELNLKDNFEDVAILWATKITTDFGINWQKALWFTFKCGFVLFLFFYFIENFNNEIDVLNYANWTRFISGLFRFFLVTDFHNPLENDRLYLTNPLSWLIFIFGKIIIAFGIYEMIQSFRKCKA